MHANARLELSDIGLYQPGSSVKLSERCEHRRLELFENKVTSKAYIGYAILYP
jgi:hypothetical protein